MVAVSGLKWCAITVLCFATASCSSTGTTPKTEPQKKRSKEYFAESEYGVKASPRVVESGAVPKGGGRFMVGNSYTIKGRRYQPREEANYDRSGLASWYGDAFHGRKTANGEVYDQNHLSAAHPTMPLPSYARITNVNNGASVLVRVNDRGPFHAGRLMDVSAKTAELLDFKRAGTGNVRVQYVGRAPLEGDDTQYLMASYVPKGGKAPADQRGWFGTMVASVRAAPSQAMGMLSHSETPAQASPEPVLMAEATQGLPAADLGFNVPVPQMRDSGYSAAPYPAPATMQVALAAQPSSNGHQALNASFGEAVALGDYPILPEFGPFVSMRPDSNYLRLPNSSYAAAYSAENQSVSRAVSAFDAVLVKENSLTEKAIVEFAKRRGKIAN